MKTKIATKPYRQILDEISVKKPHRRPKRPNIFFRTLMLLVSLPDLIAAKFSFKRIGMERLGKKEAAFFLMNHSSFIDLEIAARVLYPRPFNIVATTDAFWGKDWLMHQLGCIPTKKFTSDTTLVRDIMYAKKKLNNSVLMYPEVGYTFDGRTTTLPNTIGKCVKTLGIPLCSVRTYGAFSRDPLYNNLQKRRVKVSCEVEYLYSAEELAAMSDDEVQKAVEEQFSFDSFRWQSENNIKIDEPFRADGLERVLYKCPTCKKEGRMKGEGVYLECLECGRKYYLNEYGKMESADGGVCEFPHIPDWYAYERSCVKEELEKGEYSLDVPVEIMVSYDTKGVYRIGEGRLTHTSSGFTLDSDDGELHYEQKPLSSYSICVDFNWYEIGDIISFGDPKMLYYCIPLVDGVPVAKARLAAEELYKIEIGKKGKRNSGKD